MAQPRALAPSSRRELPRLAVAAWRAARTPAGVVIVASSVLALALVVLAETHAAGQAALWENGHWTVAAIGAFVAGVLGTRDAADAREARVRGLLTIALGCWALGQVAYDLEFLGGDPGVPSLADAAFLASLLPAGLALRAKMAGRLSSRARLAVYLDGGIILFAAGAVQLLVHGRGFEPLSSEAVVRALPLLFFVVAGVGIVGAVATQSELAPRGALAIVAGQALIGVSYSVWVDDTLDGKATVGDPVNVVFTLGLLLAGIGAATWSSAPDRRRTVARVVRSALAALPVVAVVAVSILVVLSELLAPESVQPLLLAMCGSVVAISALRQALLIREREAVTEQLTRQQRLTDAALFARERALVDREAALDQQRRATAELASRAVLLERLLAAIDALRLDALEEGVESVFQVLAAHAGADGALSRVDPARNDFLPIADAGARGQALVTRHRGLSDLPEAASRGMLAGIPGVYRRSRPADVPAGFTRLDELVLPFERPAAVLAFPIADRSGALVGGLILVGDDEDRLLDPFFIGVVRLATDVVGAAIENQRLHEAVRDQLEELERVQDRMVGAAKLSAIGELAAAVAHEINNPLTGVLGYAELLLAELPADARGRSELETIRSETLRARSTVRSLLEVSRPRRASRAATDLAELCRSTVDLLRYHVERGGVRIAERYAELPEVELDPAAIQQALLHVLTNAVQAMPDGGDLAIETRREHDEVVLLVADSGSGMTDEVREHAFTPFFTTRDPSAGAGLGLAVTLSLVAGHNGSVRIESEPGAGTTVEIRLPLVAEASEPVARPGSRRRRAVRRPPRERRLPRARAAGAPPSSSLVP